jgi:hypothetical protein
LTFTRNVPSGSPAWTGKVRGSPSRLADEDGRFLEELLLQQQAGGQQFPVDQDEWKRAFVRQVNRPDKDTPVPVTVPDDEETVSLVEAQSVRESLQIQAMLARCGERMGFRIWLPVNDRTSVVELWKPESGSLLERLPLNYNLTTLETIERIDVLWLRGSSIARAFEVEHTTAVYSGILRMADLLALLPNMDIKLHIVAPESRKEKVFKEIQRPVFAYLDRGPLRECCTFISYDSVRELLELPHLSHMADSVLEEYAEEATELP